MITQKRILVFTACYNEKENIRKLIFKIKENLLLPLGKIETLKILIPLNLKKFFLFN